MIGKGLAKRLGIVRGRVGRVGLAVTALLAVAAIAVGCETAPPSRDSAPPSFAALPPLVFDLGRIEVVERPAAPHPDDVEHLFPTPPAVAIGLWVTNRLRARGTVGVLRVTVDEASARSTRLETNADLEGLFTKEQAERLDLRLRVTIEAIDASGASQRQRLGRRQALPHIAGGHHPRRARAASTTRPCMPSFTTTTPARSRRSGSTCTSICVEADAV